MKHILMILLAVLVTLSGCMSVCPESGERAAKDGSDDILTEPDESEEEQTSMMRMKINGTPVTVAWEDNESAAALVLTLLPALLLLFDRRIFRKEGQS